MKVLLVDDDPAIRETLQEVLLSERVARTAGTLEEALVELAGATVDVVLTETLSGAWGRAAEALAPVQRLVKAAAGAPVILLTAYAEAANLDPPNVGLAGVILKPFDLDDLLACLYALGTTTRTRDAAGTSALPDAKPPVSSQRGPAVTNLTSPHTRALPEQVPNSNWQGGPQGGAKVFGAEP